MRKLPRLRCMTVLCLAVITTSSLSIFMASLNLDTASDIYIQAGGNPATSQLRIVNASSYRIRLGTSKNITSEYIANNKMKVTNPSTSNSPSLLQFFMHAHLHRLNTSGTASSNSERKLYSFDSHQNKDASLSVKDEPKVGPAFAKYNFLHPEWLNIKRDVPPPGTTETDRVHNNTTITSNASIQATIGKYVKVTIAQRPEETIDNAIDKQYAYDDPKDATEDDTLHQYGARVFRKHIYRKYYHVVKNYAGINCSEIIKGDHEAIHNAEEIMELKSRVGIRTITFSKIVNCNHFKRERGYIQDPLSDIETNFPIAFSIIVYRDVEQIERLLRAIYRPHNQYCIHADLKIGLVERNALESLAACFDNVFLASRSINVTWGEFSVLETELICMADLVHKKAWKYFINLTGQEFPLKTNREIVNILKSVGGTNIVEIEKVRAGQRYFYRWTKSEYPPPHNIRPIKGAVHVAVTRQFVEFCLHDNRAQDFLNWLRKTDIPDETFFASINYNAHLQAPGGDSSDNVPLRMATFLRFKNWRHGPTAANDGAVAVQCSGRYVRDVCVLGVADLPRATASRGLFVNKFYLRYQPLALDCLEEFLHERTWQEYLDDVTMNVRTYKTSNRWVYEIIRE